MCSLIVNFFEPEKTINGKPYKVWRYEEVLKEQLLIGILSKGACPINVSNDLPVNDRRILLNTLQQVEEEKAKRLEDVKQLRANKSKKC